jgi:hypothetical protein
MYDTVIISVFILSTFFSVLGSYQLAKNKNRDSLSWALSALFLNIISFLALIMLDKIDQTENDVRSNFLHDLEKKFKNGVISKDEYISLIEEYK